MANVCSHINRPRASATGGGETSSAAGGASWSARRRGTGRDAHRDLCQAVHADGSFGWDGGLGTSWRIDPAHDPIMVVLTQRMWERADPPQVHRDIQAAARAALA
jgi:CubicO group peptidase (beta-lactamase class C family)